MAYMPCPVVILVYTNCTLNYSHKPTSPHHYLLPPYQFLLYVYTPALIHTVIPPPDIHIVVLHTSIIKTHNKLVPYMQPTVENPENI